MKKTIWLRKSIINALTIFLLLSAFIAVFASSPVSSYAAGSLFNTSEIKPGDTIELKSGKWSEEYIALEPARGDSTNSDVTLLLKNPDTHTKFNSTQKNNVWEGSDAQAWCRNYYSNLPDALKNRIVPAYIQDMDIGDNIFGTSNLNGDNVFFLSAYECSLIQKLSEIKLDNVWWLRSPHLRISNLAAVSGSTGVTAANVESDALARPAFNLDLPEDICIHKVTFDGTLSWEIDLDATAHSYGTPTYTWKSGAGVCEANIICSYCGRTISESVYSKSKKNGDITTYTVTFSDGHFETQTYTRDASSFGSGDILRLKTGTWTGEYIILNADRCNTRDKGMFILLRDFYGNSTKFNEGLDEYGDYDDLSKENIWEGSIAQAWCTDYYKTLPQAVRDRIIGVRTTETESGYRWHEINNIDGKRDGADADKDKVFFLSSREYISYRYIANILENDKKVFKSHGENYVKKWLLRAPGTDCSQDLKVYVGVVDNDGTSRNYGAGYFEYGARPAFNINLTKDIAADRSIEDGSVVWTIDLDNIKYKTPASQDGTAGKKPSADSSPKPTASAKQLKANSSHKVGGATYRIISVKSRTVALAKAANKKNVSVPAIVKIQGKKFKVVQVNANSMRGSKIRKVTIGKNVRVIKKKAFAKSKATKLVLKTRLLKKSKVKGCLKSSKIKTVQVKVGSKKTNKKYVKKYRKIFTKKIVGRKVKVK